MVELNTFAEKNGKDLQRIAKRVADRKDITVNEVLHELYREIEEECDIKLDKEKEKLAMLMMKSGWITTFTLIKTDEDLYTKAMDILEKWLEDTCK